MVDEMTLLQAAWPAGEPTAQSRRQALERLEAAMVQAKSPAPATVRPRTVVHGQPTERRSVNGRAPMIAGPVGAVGPPKQFRWRRWATAGVAAAAAATLVVAAVTVGTGDNGPPPGEQPAKGPVVAAPTPDSAPVLLLVAAASLRSQPTTVLPKPDQWVYYAERNFAKRPAEVTEVWNRGDGRATAWLRRDGGTLVVNGIGGPDEPEYSPSMDYSVIAGLPTTAAGLQDWLLATDEHPFSPNAPVDLNVFDATMVLMRERILPPAVQAAAYELLAQMPGTSLVKDAKAADGRSVVAVRWTDDYQHDLFLDPQTYQYVGARWTAVRDVYVPGTDGTVPDDAPRTRLMARAGDVTLDVVRTALTVVDQPGQR